MSDASVDIAVLTAKKEEFRAFYDQLENCSRWVSADGTVNQYAWTLGTLTDTTSGRPFRLVLGVTHEQTNVPSALAAMNVYKEFSPRYIVFLGIAGSLSADIRKGDVFVADYIRAYQYARITEQGEFQPRPQFQEPTDQALRTNAPAFDETHDWPKRVGRRPGDGGGLPKLHFGGLASGDSVVENAEATFFTKVREQDPDLRAVEMESAGLGLVVRHLREKGEVTGLMVVRGISDIPVGIRPPTSSSNADNTRTQRKKWTRYASKCAAQFFAQFVQHAFPRQPFKDSVDFVLPSSTEGIHISFERAPQFPRIRFSLVNSSRSTIQVSDIRVVKAAEVLDDHSLMKSILGPRTHLKFSLLASERGRWQSVFGSDQVSTLRSGDFEAFDLHIQAANVVALLDVQVEYLELQRSDPNVYISPYVIAVHPKTGRGEEGSLALVERSEALRWLLNGEAPDLWSARSYAGCAVSTLLAQGAAYLCLPELQKNFAKLREVYESTETYTVLLSSLSQLLAMSAHSEDV